MRRGNDASTSGFDQSRNDCRKLYGDGDRHKRRDHGNDYGCGHCDLKENSGRAPDFIQESE